MSEGPSLGRWSPLEIALVCLAIGFAVAGLVLIRSAGARFARDPRRAIVRSTAWYWVVPLVVWSPLALRHAFFHLEHQPHEGSTSTAVLMILMAVVVPAIVFTSCDQILVRGVDVAEVRAAVHQQLRPGRGRFVLWSRRIFRKRRGLVSVSLTGLRRTERASLLAALRSRFGVPEASAESVPRDPSLLFFGFFLVGFAAFTGWLAWIV